jgi:hypothetical protein
MVTGSLFPNAANTDRYSISVAKSFDVVFHDKLRAFSWRVERERQ